LALGYTNYNTFGAHTTWNAEYGYKVSDNVRAVASIGTAFHAPSATDLYGLGGNPNLNPEKSRNAELALQYKLDRHSFAISAFQNAIDDLIMYVLTDPATFTYTASNLDRVRIRGYELSYAYAGSDWRAHAEALYQNPRDQITNQLLLRRAQRSVTAGYAQSLGTLEVGLDAVYSGPRMDFGSPANIQLGSYVLANLHSRYTVTKNLSMLVQIDNLTNVQYQLANGYNTADRSGSIALQYSLR